MLRADGTGEVGTIYTLHFDQPFGQPDPDRAQRGRGPRKQAVADWTPAKHYTGWARDAGARIAHHANGTGAALPAAVARAGIGWVVAKTERGTRDRERQIKNMGGASRRCPVCKGREPELEVALA